MRLCLLSIRSKARRGRQIWTGTRKTRKRQSEHKQYQHRLTETREKRQPNELFYGYLVSLCIRGYSQKVHSFYGFSNENHQLVIIIWDKTDTSIEWWRCLLREIIEQFVLALFTLPLVSSRCALCALRQVYVQPLEQKQTANTTSGKVAGPIVITCFLLQRIESVHIKSTSMEAKSGSSSRSSPAVRLL